MKPLFARGDKKILNKVVEKEDIAKFNGQVVHEVYSTFALARDMEWVSRLFVLEAKEDNEEGLGTEVTVKHKAPAKIGANLLFEATISSIIKNKVVCNILVSSGNRVIATGKTSQIVLKKEKIKTIFSTLD